MLLEEKTLDNIMAEMKNTVKSDVNVREGSLIDHAFRGAAAEFEQVYIELWTVDRNGYAETADREHLILRAKERGLAPIPASNAIWRAVFNVNIPIGTRFSAGELTYTCIAMDKDGTYRLQCEQAGTNGNKRQQEITELEFIEGFESGTFIELLVPGKDEEETESLRQRYFDSFNVNSFGGNRADYLEKTNVIPGVGRTKVTRVWNSNISPADMIPKEGIETWYNSIKGTLTEEVQYWLDSVFHAGKQKKLTIGGTVLLTIINSEFGPASDVLIQTVQTIIDPEENAGEGYGLAPIGHVVKVESATVREIIIKTTLTFESGYGWDNLKSLIEESVSAYLLELRKEWADTSYLIVRISHINNRILNVPGIVDIQNTLINDKRNNLSLGKYEIPVLGGVSE